MTRLLVIDGPAFKVYVGPHLVGVFPDERSARAYMVTYMEPAAW